MGAWLLRRVRSFRSPDQRTWRGQQGVRELINVWGLGSAKAQALYNVGITSIDRLRRAVATGALQGELRLNEYQKIGLQYVYDIQERIPR